MGSCSTHGRTVSNMSGLPPRDDSSTFYCLSWDNQKCLQTLPHVPQGAKSLMGKLYPRLLHLSPGWSHGLKAGFWLSLLVSESLVWSHWPVPFHIRNADHFTPVGGHGNVLLRSSCRRKGVGEQNSAAPPLDLTRVHALLSHAVLRLLQANDWVWPGHQSWALGRFWVSQHYVPAVFQKKATPHQPSFLPSLLSQGPDLHYGFVSIPACSCLLNKPLPLESSIGVFPNKSS